MNIPKVGCVNHDCDRCKNTRQILKDMEQAHYRLQKRYAELESKVGEHLSELQKDAENLLFALHDAWPYVHQWCTIDSKKKNIQALMRKHGDFGDVVVPEPKAEKPIEKAGVEAICDQCETVAHCLKNGCVPKQQPEPVQEPDAYLHDDGYWTAAKTYAGRQLNDRLLFAGSAKIGVYTTPPAAPEK